jgi:type VI secretion system secreted protein VgrG
VGSSATLGTSSTFVGTVMAYASITMNASAILNGRAMAQNGAVTFNGSGGNLPLPAAPIFTNGTPARTNSAIVTLLTSPYFPLTLQTSTNLITWSSIATNNPVTSLSSFTNPVPTGVPHLFYRAFLTPYP